MRQQPLPTPLLKASFSQLFDGRATEAQAAAFLTYLTLKGPSSDEVLLAAKLLQACMRPLPGPFEKPLLDIVGTGGDGLRTFNVSTAAMFVAAGAGCRVAKHGNKSFSSATGAADALAALGVNAQLSPPASARLLRQTGCCFLYAPLFHPALANLAKVRKELGFRTLFNLLGPLLNPAHASRRLIGADSPQNARLLAACLAQLNLEHCLVVHGALQGTGNPGLDELSTLGDNLCLEVKGPVVREFTLSPRALGFPAAKLAKLQVNSAAESAEKIRRVLEGKRGPARDLVLLNAAAALYVYGLASSIKEAIPIAEASLDSGKALAKLEQLKEASNHVPA